MIKRGDYRLAGKIIEPEMDLQEIADVLGLSRERIRQIEATALKKLRVALADFDREDL